MRQCRRSIGQQDVPGRIYRRLYVSHVSIYDRA